MSCIFQNSLLFAYLYIHICQINHILFIFLNLYIPYKPIIFFRFLSLFSSPSPLSLSHSPAPPHSPYLSPALFLRVSLSLSCLSNIAKDDTKTKPKKSKKNKKKRKVTAKPGDNTFKTRLKVINGPIKGDARKKNGIYCLLFMSCV